MKKFFCALFMSALFVSQSFAVSDAERQIIDILGQVARNTGVGGAATTVTTAVKQYTGTPSNFTVGTSDATVFTLAAGEIGRIQNLSATIPLAVKYGASASSSSFTWILPAGNAQDDGKGGAYIINDWVGVVSVAGVGGTARYMASKQAP